MNDLIKQLVKMNKIHMLNQYIITDRKEYMKRVINGKVDSYQKYMYDHQILRDKKAIKKISKVIPSFFRYVDSSFYYDKKLVINILNKGFSYKEVLKKLLQIYEDDFDVIKHIIKNNGTFYNDLKEEYKNNKQIIELAIRHSFNENIYINLDEKYKNDYSLALLAVKYSKSHHAFFHIKEEFQREDEIIKEALKNNGWGYQYLSDDIKNNRDYALMAVANNGYALKFLKEEFKNDFEIVLTAFLKNPKSIEYASYQMREVIEFVS